MRREQKMSVIYVGAISLIIVIWLVIYTSGYHFFFSESYGKEFNNKRIQLGQPIVEPYFILKSEKYDGRQTWITPDSINGSKIHDSKYVGTVLGKIDYEIDYYNVLLDSTSIHLLNFDTLYYETIIHDSVKWKKHKKKTFPYSEQFQRLYYYRTDSVLYDMGIYITDHKVLRKYLNKVRGDSIIEAHSLKYR